MRTLGEWRDLVEETRTNGKNLVTLPIDDLDALLAAVPIGALPDVVRAGDLVVDLAERVVMIAGKQLHVTRVEYAILAAIAKRRGGTVTFEQLNRIVWNFKDVDPCSDFNRIKVRVCGLRQRLGIPTGSPGFIQSIRGWGFALVMAAEKGADHDQTTQQVDNGGPRAFERRL